MGENANGQSPPNGGQDLSEHLGVILGVLIDRSAEIRQILRHLAFQHLLTQEELESIFAWPNNVTEDEVYAGILKCHGMTHEKIAEKLGVGPKRVEQIFASLREKCAVDSTEEVIVLLVRAGLVQSRPPSRSRNPNRN